MLEILALCIGSAGLAQFARLRGGRGWPWVVAALVGYVIATYGAMYLVGLTLSIFGGAAWFAVMFLSVFLFVGKGKRNPSTWECPNCRFPNDELTLVCSCGFKTQEVAGAQSVDQAG